MKKLLSFLGSLSLIAVSATTVIACGDGNQAAALKVDLSEHISTQRIADFHHNDVSEAEILTMAKKANPDLNLNEVEVKFNTMTQADGQINIIPNEAILTVKKDSKVYNPGVSFVYFTVPQYPRVALASVLRQTDLGEILTPVNNPTAVLLSEVRRRLKELNPALELSFVDLAFQSSDPDGGKIALTLKDGSPYFGDLKQKTILTYKFQKSAIDLNEVVRQSNLGVLDYYDEWEDSTLLSIIGRLNIYLDTSEVRVISKDRSFDGKVRIAAKENSIKYKKPSFADFSFTPKVNIDLEQDLKNLDLGLFDDEPTDEQILTRIKELNPLVDLKEIYVASNSADKIIIREKFGSTKYWQTKMELSYEVKDHYHLQDIWNAIEYTDLGELDVSVNGKKVILDKLKELNPWLDLNHLGIEQLEVIQHRNGFATIRVVKGSLIYSPGSVEVSYINTKKLSLKETMTGLALRNTMMGVNTLNDKITDTATIFKNLKFFNPKLDIDQLLITKIDVGNLTPSDRAVAKLSVIFTVDPKSNIYKVGEQPIEWNFNLFKKVPLSTMILNRHLGDFKTIPTFDELWSRIIQVNKFTDIPEIFRLQANLLNDGDGHVKLSIAFPGFEVLTGSVDLTYKVI